ncbi:MAG: hypothetical protein ICV31_05885 [Rubrobacter sp.]|nr:hypothetical protein [Rubrobacter sp.]
MVSRETLEFQSIEAIKRCVSAGMGVSVLPAVSVETELAAGGLSELRWHEPDRVGTLMAWNERRWGSPALRAFLGRRERSFPPRESWCSVTSGSFGASRPFNSRKPPLMKDRG